MNAPNEPLPADVVDELLSAELDGAFDAAARERGFTPATARERLDETPGARERRAALAAARDSLAVPPLADAARERLLAGACAAHERDELRARRGHRSRTRVATLIAAAAAAIALVVGIGATITSIRDRDNDDSGVASDAPASSDALERERSVLAPTTGASAADSGADAEAAPSGGAVTYDFGTVANAGALRAGVQGAMRERVQLLTGARAGNTTAPPLSLSPDASAFDRRSPTASAACVAVQTADAAAGASLLVRGPVVYAGTPAEVLVFSDADDVLAVVVDDAGARCTLLDTQLVDPQP